MIVFNCQISCLFVFFFSLTHTHTNTFMLHTLAQKQVHAPEPKYNHSSFLHIHGHVNINFEKGRKERAKKGRVGGIMRKGKREKEKECSQSLKLNWPTALVAVACLPFSSNHNRLFLALRRNFASIWQGKQRQTRRDI